MKAEIKKQEQARVDRVVQQIKDRLTTMREQLARTSQETRRIEQNYGDSTRVNVTEVDDRMETNAAVQQQKQMVARAVESEAIMTEQVDRLAELEDFPYFGRIDIKEMGEHDTLYIGTATFLDEDQNFLIYDWRAPIASIYYNGTLGDVSYETPMGEQQAILELKRQFMIEKGQITHLFDTNETVGDELLQHVLGTQNDSYMQNIVATIQREQNSIIRNTQSDLLVVQGVAGSGKTSAILQRIAFLLYHSRRDLEADQMVLFSPNRLFSHYISEVLPSLGEKNMRQVTLDEFFTGRFTGIHVESLFERFERDLVNLPTATKAMRRFKEAPAFMTLVENYVHEITADDIAFTDILFEGIPFFTAKQIREIFRNLPEKMLVSDKFAAIKKQLYHLLKQKIKAEIKSDWVSELISLLDNATYHELTQDKTFADADAEYAYLAEQILAGRYTEIEAGIYNDYFLDSYEQYGRFLAAIPAEQLPVEAKIWQGMILGFNQNIERHYINLEDTTPILMLRDLLTGGGMNHSIQYLFIDEMQDYSLAQILYIHHAFPKAKLTVLGDVAQDIFSSSYSETDFITALCAQFADKKQQVITLNKSYRSTAPITNFAKQLIENGDTIEAFNRDGSLPRYYACDDAIKARQLITEEAEKLLTHYQNVAILTKDMGTATALYGTLQGSAETTLVLDGDRSFPDGIIILPLYLAKGLEFDAVIGYDLSAKTYGSKADQDLIYTLATRAMHELILLSIGEPAASLAPLTKQHLIEVQ